MKHWYSYRSKDKKVRGYCPAKSELEVARFAGYPVSELVIERVDFNGEEFVREEVSDNICRKEEKMKLLGSRIVRIGCMECGANSEKFKVTLAEDEVDGALFFPRGYPGGWMAPAEAELNGDMIYGYCPEHTHLLGQ